MNPGRCAVRHAVIILSLYLLCLLQFCTGRDAVDYVLDATIPHDLIGVIRPSVELRSAGGPGPRRDDESAVQAVSHSAAEVNTNVPVRDIMRSAGLSTHHAIILAELTGCKELVRSASTLPETLAMRPEAVVDRRDLREMLIQCCPLLPFATVRVNSTSEPTSQMDLVQLVERLVWPSQFDPLKRDASPPQRTTQNDNNAAPGCGHALVPAVEGKQTFEEAISDAIKKAETEHAIGSVHTLVCATAENDTGLFVCSSVIANSLTAFRRNAERREVLTLAQDWQTVARVMFPSQLLRQGGTPQDGKQDQGFSSLFRFDRTLTGQGFGRTLRTCIVCENECLRVVNTAKNPIRIWIKDVFPNEAFVDPYEVNRFYSAGESAQGNPLNTKLRFMFFDFTDVEAAVPFGRSQLVLSYLEIPQTQPHNLPFCFDIPLKLRYQSPEPDSGGSNMRPVNFSYADVSISYNLTTVSHQRVYFSQGTLTMVPVGSTIDFLVIYLVHGLLILLSGLVAGYASLKRLTHTPIDGTKRKPT